MTHDFSGRSLYMGEISGRLTNEMSHLALSFVCLWLRRICWLGAAIVALGLNGVVEAQPPAPVVVAPAEERLLAPVTFFPGTVISRDDARLAAEVEGRLEWVADIGTSVKRGQSVARLDDDRIAQLTCGHCLPTIMGLSGKRGENHCIGGAVRVPSP